MKRVFAMVSVFLITVILFLVIKMYINKKNDEIAYYIKEGKLNKAYYLSESTLIFDKYSIFEEANLFLANMYMFNFNNLEKVDLSLSEYYCNKSKICDIEYLYKQAQKFYCKSDKEKKNFSVFGYRNKNSREFNERICKEVMKRIKHLNK